MWTLPSDAFTGTGLVSTNPATSVNFVSGLIPGGPVRAGPASAGTMPTPASVPVSTATPPSSDRSMRTSRRYGVVIKFGPRICPSSRSLASTRPSYASPDPLRFECYPSQKMDVRPRGPASAAVRFSASNIIQPLPAHQRLKWPNPGKYWTPSRWFLDVFQVLNAFWHQERKSACGQFESLPGHHPNQNLE